MVWLIHWHILQHVCLFVCLRWQTALQLVQQQRKESGSYLWQAVFLMFCCSVNTSRTVYDSSPEEVFCYMLIVVIFWAELQSTTHRDCISAPFQLLFLPSKSWWVTLDASCVKRTGVPLSRRKAIFYESGLQQKYFGKWEGYILLANTDIARHELLAEFLTVSSSPNRGPI